MSVSEAAREGRFRGLEVAIVDCISRWGRDYPHEVVALANEMKFLRDTEHRKGGWSRERHFLHKGRVPTSLCARMRNEIDLRWLDNPEIRDLFFRLFKIGTLNKSDLSNR